MNTSIKYLILIIYIISNLTLLYSQSKDYPGVPYIENYTLAADYNLDHMLVISQDRRGIMYFGTRKGIFEFDGVTWRIHEIPNKSKVSSLATDSTGMIYIGANNELGYLKPNDNGKFKYHSLNHLIPSKHKMYHSVRKIFLTKQGVYYICNRKVFRHYNDTIEVIPINMMAENAFYINGTIFIMDRNIGLSQINENELIPLPNCEIINRFKNSYHIFNTYSKSKILIIHSKESRFYTYDIINQKLERIEIPQITQHLLIKNFAFNIAKPDDNTYAISTGKGGIVFIDKKGNIKNIINENSGLISNTVFSMFLDNEKNLWANTNRGVARVDLSYPGLFLNKHHGIRTNVTCSKIYNGFNYLGLSSSDLCYVPKFDQLIYSNNCSITKVSGTTYTKAFIEKGRLLACHDNGISELINGSTNSLFKPKVGKVFCLEHNEKYPNKIFIGTNHRIIKLTVKENTKKGTLELTNEFSIWKDVSQVRSMAFDNEGNLWFACYNEGIYKIHFKDGDIKDYNITHYNESNGLPKEIQEAYIANLNGKINIFTQKGIYKLSTNKIGSEIKFIHDKYWGKLFTTDSTAVNFVHKIENDKYFIVGKKNGILNINDSTTDFNDKPFLKLGEINWVTSDISRYLHIGGPEYFCIYDTFNDKDYSKTYYTLIRNVTISSNDSILFNGAYFDHKKNKVTIEQSDNYKPTLPYKLNSLKFNFSASYLESSSENQYRYKIEGFDKEWSSWTKETSATYTNLPYGNFTFKVMCKNIYGTTSKTATYSFTIEPAWYQTTFAYFIYSILSGFLIYLIIIAYTRRLSKQNAKLENIVRLRTKELQEAIGILEKQKIELKNKQKEILTQNSALTDQGQKLQETIDKLKNMQSSLVQQEKMASLGILTAGVAHEINNPLNYILGGYTGLEYYFNEENVEDPEIEILMESIKTGVERAANIVASLNQFSRNKETFDENCDIHSILNNSTLMIKHLLKNRIELVKNYVDKDPNIMGNVGKLHQVFINIITNSCQAIEGTGIITINTSIENNHLEIRINDTGSGIDPDNLNKITDPFFTTKEPGKGSGLGLSITYKIVQEHKGSLEYESEVKKGTTAIIKFPLKDSKDEKN